MIAPAVIGRGIPIVCAIPIKANPTVPAVPQEPKAMEIRAHTSMALAKNRWGEISFNP